MVSLCRLRLLRPAKGKTIQMDDPRWALQGPGDERKLARLEELMLLQIEIKKARAINGLEAGSRNLGD